MTLGAHVFARGPIFRFFEHLRMGTIDVVFENRDHLLRSIEAAAGRPPWADPHPANRQSTPDQENTGNENSDLTYLESL
jgi:hypothetical protein